MRQWLLLLAGIVAMGLASTGAAWGKVGLDYMSAEERKKFFKTVDQYAHAEAIMTVCSKRTGLERRVFLAAKPCVTAKALARVRRYYRSRLHHHKGRINPHACRLPKVRQLFPKIRTAVSKLVEQIKTTCAMCLFC